MNDLFREAITAAERAAVNEESLAQDYIERLLNDPDEARSAKNEERSYLAVLLNSIGLHDESIRVLRASSGPGQATPNATLLNVEGMLAAARGDYERAQQVLNDALSAASSSPVLRVKVLANLAAVSLEAGAVDVAKAWAAAASAEAAGRVPASDVLIASVQAGIAAARQDLPGLRAASASLSDASRARVDELGPHHPQALAVVANMARIEVMLASAEGSLVRLERATGVLEITAFRLAAELGADHPLSVAAKASLSAAESSLTDIGDHAGQMREANTRGRRKSRLAAGAVGEESSPVRFRRKPAMRSARIPDRAAAAASVDPSATAGMRLGGGQYSLSASGAVAVADNPIFHRKAAGSQPTWIPAYLRRVVIADIATAAVFSILALQPRFGGHITPGYAALNLIFPLLWVATLWLCGAYGDRYIGTGSDEFRKVVNAGVSLTAGLAILSYAVDTELSRAYLLITMPGVTSLGLIVRYAMRKRLYKQRATGRCMSTVLAVGPEAAVAGLITELRRDTSHGLTVVATCLTGATEGREVAGVPVFGGFADVVAAVRQCDADTVAVLSSAEIDGRALRQLAWELEKTGTDLCVAPALLDVAGPRTTVRPTAGLTLLHVDHPQLGGPRQVLKGVFDRVTAAMALVVLSPLFLALAVVIRLSDNGPALFTQTRVGKDGRAFKIYKFRTMVVDAEERQAELRASSAFDGVLFKMRRDPRVTAIGARLRKRSMDELPELINVLKGDMSLVGPRPAQPDEVAQYADHVRRRLIVKPGISGLWQVNGRQDLSWEESVRLDLRYVENWSFALDLQILWKTIGAIFRGSGAY